jgi:CheY-like chemotaxis protein
MKTCYPNFIVGIGGSAGGLRAYKALLDALPSNTGMAFVIVSHILPTAHSQLAQILSKHTKMTVMVACMGLSIRANHVYVSPPNADLLIESYTFKVVFPRSGRKQIDFFLTSLAEAMGARAIGIIFSGYDGDGTEGCKHIKTKGGTTFAQDRSAEVEDMSLSAQASGCVDFVLPPDKIPDELQRLVSASPDENSALWNVPVTQRARILIAATPDSIADLERILKKQHESVVVSTMSEALVQLRIQAFDLVMIGVHFNESRMFDLLPEVHKSPENADTPIICFSTRDTPLTRAMHQSIDVLSKLLGAWMYLDQHEFSVSKDPDAEMRRIIERCLTGEARKKTTFSRMEIQKEREELYRLREALEVHEWSENLEDRVVELRQNLAALLLELFDSNESSLTQQDHISYSQEHKDQVSEAVQLAENEATQKEGRLLLDETEQTLKEQELGEREERKRKEGRRNPGENEGKKKPESGPSGRI